MTITHSKGTLDTKWTRVLNQIIRTVLGLKVVKLSWNLFRIPYCSLFLWALNFMKIEWAYFAGINFRDLAKKYIQNVKKTTLKIGGTFGD